MRSGERPKALQSFVIECDLEGRFSISDLNYRFKEGQQHLQRRIDIYIGIRDIQLR